MGGGERLDFWLLFENQGFWKLETTFFLNGNRLEDSCTRKLFLNICS